MAQFNLLRKSTSSLSLVVGSLLFASTSFAQTGTFVQVTGLQADVGTNAMGTTGAIELRSTGNGLPDLLMINQSYQNSGIGGLLTKRIDGDAINSSGGKTVSHPSPYQGTTQYGESVSDLGDLIAISAPNHGQATGSNCNGDNRGRVDFHSRTTLESLFQNMPQISASQVLPTPAHYIIAPSDYANLGRILEFSQLDETSIQNQLFVTGERCSPTGNDGDGAVFIYQLDNNTQAPGSSSQNHTPTPIHVIESPQSGTDFGQAIKVIPDVNGDGISELAVGDPDATVCSGVHGAVYVYSGQHILSGQTHQIGNPLCGEINIGSSLDSRFGAAIEAADGRLFVGAPEQDGCELGYNLYPLDVWNSCNGGSNIEADQGAVFIFKYINNTWVRESERIDARVLTMGNTAAAHSFGASLVHLPSTFADGTQVGPFLQVGAQGRSTGLTNAGSVSQLDLGRESISQDLTYTVQSYRPAMMMHYTDGSTDPMNQSTLTMSTQSYGSSAQKGNLLGSDKIITFGKRPSSASNTFEGSTTIDWLDSGNGAQDVLYSAGGSCPYVKFATDYAQLGRFYGEEPFRRSRISVGVTITNPQLGTPLDVLSAQIANPVVGTETFLFWAKTSDKLASPLPLVPQDPSDMNSPAVSGTENCTTDFSIFDAILDRRYAVLGNMGKPDFPSWGPTPLVNVSSLGPAITGADVDVDKKLNVLVMHRLWLSCQTLPLADACNGTAQPTVSTLFTITDSLEIELQ